MNLVTNALTLATTHGLLVALAILLAGCATDQPEGHTSHAEDEPLREGAFVVSGIDLEEGTGSVLSAHHRRDDSSRQCVT